MEREFACVREGGREKIEKQDQQERERKREIERENQWVSERERGERDKKRE